MKIYGIYQSYDKENESCVIHSDDCFFSCTGLVPRLRKNTPVIVEAENSDFSGSVSVSSFLFNFSDKALFSRFFSGPVFRGIGKKKAEAVYDRLLFEYQYLKKDKNSNICNTDILYTDIYNTDIDFTELDEKIVRKILSEEGVSDATAIIFLNEMYGLKRRMSIFSEIKKYDGTYHEAGLLYEKYGENAVSEMRIRPYDAVKAGISFHLSDIFSYANGGQYLSSERMDAMLFTLSGRICNDGSTCAELPKLLKTAKKILRTGASGFPIIPDDCIFSSLLSTRYIITKKIGEKMLFYPKKYYFTESLLAKEIKRLQVSGNETGFPGYEGVMELDDDQVNAMNALSKEGIKIITGGPGSGKTTLIRELIAAYKKLFPKFPFFLSAPTGRAAVRIQESSGFPAVTIHKLLGVRPYSSDGEISLKYTKENKLPRGLFIIDEMSMVGEEMFLKLLSAIPDRSIVILSGDPRQLESVDPGNVLSDLIRSNVIETYHLTKIHRQGSNSAIVRNYYDIRDYNFQKVVSDASFSVINVKTRSDALSAIMDIGRKYDSPDNPYSFQILSFTKKGELGKDVLNHQFILQKKEGGTPLYFGRSSYSVGDKIMMTKNNYKKDYWNGDVGLITNVSDEYMEALFYNGIRTIGRDSLKDMDHAYVCTVHKAQGSEYDTVLVVIDDSYKGMLYNSIILTAVTRAKKRAFIVSVGNSFKKAVETRRDCERVTGLAELLN